MSKTQLNCNRVYAILVTIETRGDVDPDCRREMSQARQRLHAAHARLEAAQRSTREVLRRKYQRMHVAALSTAREQEQAASGNYAAAERDATQTLAAWRAHY